MFYRILCAGLATVCLAVLPSFAAAETFLLVPGVGGDAVEKNHKGWIRVSAVNWEVAAPSSWTQGAGATIARPKSGDLRLTIPTGLWSSAFVRAMTSGVLLGGGQRLVLDHTASDGRVLYRIGLDNVFATKYTIASTAQGLPDDLLEVVFKAISIEHYALGADGRTIASKVSWDVSTGTVN